MIPIRNTLFVPRDSVCNAAPVNILYGVEIVLKNYKYKLTLYTDVG